MHESNGNTGVKTLSDMMNHHLDAAARDDADVRAAFATAEAALRPAAEKREAAAQGSFAYPQTASVDSSRVPKVSSPGLMWAMGQLFEMGFWNQDLNRQLLEKNKLNVSDTVEELLRTSSVAASTAATQTPSASPTVVQNQPLSRDNDPFFICDFD